MEEFKPGQVISPQSHAASPPTEPPVPPAGAPEPERPVEEPEPAPQPTPAPEPAAPIEPAPVATAAPAVPDEPSSGWQFRTEADTTPARPEPAVDNLNWTASEFIAHEKSAGWYAMLALAGVAAAALVYLVTKDKVSTGVVVFVAIVLGFFAGRPPRTQQYSLTGRGLQIGQKLYDFQDFKTFSVAEEGAIASISFMPLKRFMPSLTIYVAPDLEEQVINFLSVYLPFEHRKPDMVDSLVRRLRF